MPAYLDGFVRALETVLDEVAISAIKAKLDANSDKLGQREFQNLRVSETAFGGSPKGGQLGAHHGRAHQVISETLDGVIQDMRDFREGVEQAEKLLDVADTTAGDTLVQRRAAVEQLEDANRWFAGDHKFHGARGDQEADR